MPPSPEFSSDSLSEYLNQIGNYELLTAEDEVELAQSMEAGKKAATKLEALAVQNGHASTQEKEELAKIALAGEAAKEKFINSNLRLVVSVARRYHKPGSIALEFGDSIQAGNQGLIRAVEKFNWRRGFKFSTYATWWIRQAITRERGNASRTIRYPVHISEAVATVTGSIGELMQRGHQKPTPEQIAEHSGLDPHKVIDVLAHINETGEIIALDNTVGDDGATVGDFIEDRNSNAEELAIRNMISSEIADPLSKLDEKHRDIIELRYGLRNGKIHTLEDIGLIYNVTRERIRQIERSALNKLRQDNEIRKLIGLPEFTNEDFEDTA